MSGGGTAAGAYVLNLLPLSYVNFITSDSLSRSKQVNLSLHVINIDCMIDRPLTAADVVGDYPNYARARHTIHRRGDASRLTIGDDHVDEFARVPQHVFVRLGNDERTVSHRDEDCKATYA